MSEDKSFNSLVEDFNLFRMGVKKNPINKMRGCMDEFDDLNQ